MIRLCGILTVLAPTFHAVRPNEFEDGPLDKALARMDNKVDVFQDRLTKLELVQMQSMNKAREFAEYIRQAKEGVNSVHNAEKGFNEALANAARSGLKPVYEALDRGHFMPSNPLLGLGIEPSTLKRLKSFEQPGLYNLYQNHSRFKGKELVLNGDQTVLQVSPELKAVNDKLTWTTLGVEYLKAIGVPFALHLQKNNLGQEVTESQMHELFEFEQNSRPPSSDGRPTTRDLTGIDMELSHYRQMGFISPRLTYEDSSIGSKWLEKKSWGDRLLNAYKDTWLKRKLIEEFGEGRIRKDAMLTVKQQERINAVDRILLCKGDDTAKYTGTGKVTRTNCEKAQQMKFADLENLHLFTFASVEHILAQARNER